MGRSKKNAGSARKYSDQHLLCAIQAVKDGSTQFAAAKKFGIPRSTLFNKISGKSEMGKKSGPGTVLSTKEENVIEKWIFNLARRGFPVGKRQLIRSVQMYLNTQKRVTQFVNNLPGRKWYKSFLNRHPTISKKISQNLTPNRAAVTEHQIRCWHAEVHKYCEDNNLIEALNDPTRIFNMDEKGFILTPKNQVVLTKRGDKAVYKRSQNDDKECVTALLGGNAAGTPTPPIMVHAYKRMPSTILLHMPPKWSVGISENGWQTQATFYDYITNVFYKWLLDEEIKLPIILFIDGHKSHISLPLSDFCADHKIELVALYPNSTHLIQPMDVGVLKPVNTSWGNKVDDWKLIHKYAKIEKKDIAPILNDAINAIDYGSYLQKGFKKSGLFPFVVENIDFSRILPTAEAAAASQNELWNAERTTALNTAQIALENEKCEALSRLKHFERLIDGGILNLFKLSSENWSGSMEYGPLFVIWQKMRSEVLDSSTTILDVDSSDPPVQLSVLNEENGQYSMLCDNDSIMIEADDSQLLNSEGTDSMMVEYEYVEDHRPIDLDIDEEYTLVEAPHCVDVIMLAERSSRKAIDSMIVENGEAKELNIDDTQIHPSADIEAEIRMTVGSTRNGDVDDSMIAEHTKFGNGEPIVLVMDELCAANEIAHSVQNTKPTEVYNENGVGSMSLVVSKQELPIDLSMPKETSTTFIAKSSGETFDVEAFKNSFFWPTAPIKKKKEKLPQEIRSTVVTSDEWREKEREKWNDKLKTEAEKRARKLDREIKKKTAAAMAAEKKMAKEIEKNKKAVQKANLAAVMTAKKESAKEMKKNKATLKKSTF